jgi:hypothetical protein
MPPGLRRFALTVHVACSVGWLGAVAAFAGIAVAGLASDDVQVVRGVYLVMEVSGWFVLVPLAVASLLTGLAQSLGTSWGLFRHYWVLFKLAINVFATAILFAYTQTLEDLADTARVASTVGDLDALRSPSPLLHSLSALVLLFLATMLAIYKPRGLTPYGLRKLRLRAATRAG